MSRTTLPIASALVALLAAASNSTAQEPVQQPLDLQSLPRLDRADDHVAVAVYLASDLFTLELDRYSLRPAGSRRAGAAPAVTYRGHLAEEPGSRVAASVRGDVLRAIVWRYGDPEPWWIAPSNELDPSLPAETHTAVRAGDLPEGTLDLACGVDHAAEPQRMPAGGAAESSGVVAAEVVIEADYEYYLSVGSVAGAEDLIEETFNFASAIYESTFGIRFQIAHLKVWDVVADPYDHTESNSAALTEFNNYVKQNFSDDKWDLAQLFTQRTFAGGTGVIGFAYIGRFCQTTSPSRATSWVKNMGSLAGRTILTAHEVGHNLSAGHCNGDPDCGIMRSSLPSDSAGGLFGSQSIASITSYPYLMDCVDATVPSGPAPTLGSIAPSTVEALVQGSGTETATLSGTDLDFVHQVSVGSTTLTLVDLPVVASQAVVLDVPTPSALGPVSVSALNGGGWSNAVTLTYDATSPPRMNVTSSGYPLGIDLEFGGGPNVAYQVLISTSSATVSSGGVDVLANPIDSEIGTLDAIGLGSSAFYPSFGTYWVQLVSRDNGALYATTPVAVVY